jgi:transcriptional regulator with GAF, ATPase, and Fis domain
MQSQGKGLQKNQRNEPDQENLNEQLSVLRATNRIGHLLSRTSGVQTAINKLMEEVINFVNANEVSIQLLRPSTGTTRCTLIRDDEKGYGILDKRLDDFLTGWILENKQSLLSDDLSSLLEMEDIPQRYSNVRSLIAAPLLSEKTIIGSINLIRTHASKVFSLTDQLLVSNLATQIGDFIEEASVRELMFTENERLRKDLDRRFSVHGIIGESTALKEVFKLMEQVIPTDARLVISGESGTGKELIAKCVHFTGPRKERSFIAVDCGALPANLLESELFGYVRGAFTGANQNRRGLIEEADKGTLFLDEITNMNIETQAKLLRVLQEGEVRPLGSNQTKKVDVRVIVAASTNLEERVSSGDFRSDLFYRLNVVSIHSPALRERIEDIPILSKLFIRKFGKKHGKSINNISPETMQILERYSWPGNIRELENAVERAVVMIHFEDKILLPKHLPDEVRFSSKNRNPSQLLVEGDLPTILANYERELLDRVLRHYNWNQSAAAKALNISEAVMRYKMKRLILRKSDQID